ncbi:P-loop NTPase family protein [Thermocoleostomius sinensis]|uniref:P-loop NTPase family protein n=1 Tax=Thermocoleostomius sinensis A174 TaxID=2016057 RepID=A0A9E8ZCJ5_9CYAN|nr:P-loop NTPase family protein [Thermocoleostomius sinensis]WAL60643.1 P-loop NTPase family protein [Thermocoleostomius sinensis A174]
MVSQLETPLRDSNHSLPYAIEGLVQVFTCPHRSFFTGVMAQALRIAGQGTPVLIVQFLKGGIGQGPRQPIQLGQHLDWMRCSLMRCINTPELEPTETDALRELWEHTQTVVSEGKYSLVVLDELSLAIQFGLISEAEVLHFLKHRPSQVDVILTGPEMPSAILDVADQITELRRTYRP